MGIREGVQWKRWELGFQGCIERQLLCSGVPRFMEVGEESRVLDARIRPPREVHLGRDAQPLPWLVFPQFPSPNPSTTERARWTLPLEAAGLAQQSTKQREANLITGAVSLQEGRWLGWALGT